MKVKSKKTRGHQGKRIKPIRAKTNAMLKRRRRIKRKNKLRRNLKLERTSRINRREKQRQQKRRLEKKENQKVVKKVQLFLLMEMKKRMMK